MHRTRQPAHAAQPQVQGPGGRGAWSQRLAGSPRQLAQAGAIQAVMQREAFVGEASKHHLHIDIAQPHYKLGKSQASRINFGSWQDYRRPDLELVIEAVKGRLGETGAQACYDWSVQTCRDLKAQGL